MARGSTVRTFEIELSDVDRGVYETLSLKVAQHPSESGSYLVTRLLAYALEFREGLTFSSGLGNADEPALWVRDLTDQVLAIIEIGTPAPERLHKASKAADEVSVYCHKDRTGWLQQLAAASVHRSEHIALWGLPWRQVQDLASRVDRRNQWALSRVDNVVYLEIDGESLEVALQRLDWPER